MDFISGEKFQQICSVYFGEQEDFSFNPRIADEKHKHKYISRFTQPFYNPMLVFCYTHRISEFASKVHLFKNKFVLISHNSDYTITEKDIEFLNNENIIHWFSQNANVVHPKLTPIPIGIANQQWEHGKYSNWNDLTVRRNKDKDAIYFYFSIDTNPVERFKCKQILQKKGIEYWKPMPHPYYLDNLSRFCKYSICPEGNGVDTHRLWEALYTNTIPVCIRSVNSEYFSKEYPIVLLDKWEDFDISMKEPQLEIDHNKLKFSYYTDLILSKAYESIYNLSIKEYNDTVTIITGLIEPIFVENLIKSYKNVNHKVISTWKDSNPQLIEQLKQNKFNIVLCDYPTVETDITRQMKCIQAGLQWAIAQGFTYACRSRTDIFPEDHLKFLYVTRNLYTEKVTTLCGISLNSTTNYYLDIIICGDCKKLLTFVDNIREDGVYLKCCELSLLENHSGTVIETKEDVKKYLNFSLDICIKNNIEIIWYRPAYWKDQVRTIPNMKVIKEYCTDWFIYC